MEVAERLARIDARMDHHGFKDRLGQCYVIAGNRVVETPGALIVHGSIELVGSPIDHAWAILDAGEETERVFEPATNATWTPDEFVEIFGARERVRYTRDEFTAIILSVCHWGPFDAGAKTDTNYFDREAVEHARKELS